MIFDELEWKFMDDHAGFMPDGYETCEDPSAKSINGSRIKI